MKRRNPATESVRDALSSLPPEWVSDELAQALEVRAASSAVARHLAERIDSEQEAVSAALAIGATTAPKDLEEAAVSHVGRLAALQDLAGRIRVASVPEHLEAAARTIAGRDVLAAVNALEVPPSRYEADMQIFRWSAGGPLPPGVRPGTAPPRMAEPPVRLPIDERVAAARAKLDQAVTPIRREILEVRPGGVGWQPRWTSPDVLVDLQRAAQAVKALDAAVPLADELRRLIADADAERPPAPHGLDRKIAALAAQP